MRPLKPIQTRYKGHHFRSRLEARWAVFLDRLGMPWKYEDEGYELPDGTRYLPDFWLPPLHSFLEIKPENPKLDDLVRAQTAMASLIENGESRVAVIALGGPSSDTNHNDGIVMMRDGNPHLSANLTPIAGLLAMLVPYPNATQADREVLLRSAVSAAKSARFEFGESGAS